MLRVFTNNVGSQGLTTIREAIDNDIRAINRHHGERNLAPILASENGSARLFNNSNRFILNWGTSNTLDNPQNNFVLNSPEAVGRATNKLSAFRAFRTWNEDEDSVGNEVNTVTWTTNREVAQAWLVAGNTVYSRTRLQGHSGEGIVVNQEDDTADELPNAPLYTLGITGSRREYRVHVFNGEVILTQLKKRRNTATGGEVSDNGNTTANDQVRNLGGGWVYSVSDSSPSLLVREQAIRAVEVLGLDFGAVDIIAKGRKNNETSAFVLEVNTAPGQGGDTTVMGYGRSLLTAYSHWKNCQDANVPFILDDVKHLDTRRVLTDSGLPAERVDFWVNQEVDDEVAPAVEAPAPFIHDEVSVDVEATPMNGRIPPEAIFDRATQEPPQPVRTVRRSGQPQPEPVVMPTAVVGVSRLARTDPQNEQFVVFTYQERTEVGVVNTARGVVYMAGSDIPLPIGEVTLTATVNTTLA